MSGSVRCVSMASFALKSISEQLLMEKRLINQVQIDHAEDNFHAPLYFSLYVNVFLTSMNRSSIINIHLYLLQSVRKCLIKSH